MSYYCPTLILIGTCRQILLKIANNGFFTKIRPVESYCYIFNGPTVMMKPLITFDNFYAKAPKILRHRRVPSTRNTKFESLEYEGTLTTSTVVCVWNKWCILYAHACDEGHQI